MRPHRLTHWCGLGFPVCLALGLSMVAMPAHADPPFTTPPFGVYSPTPMCFTYLNGAVSNNCTDFPPKKKLVIPLFFEAVDLPSSELCWDATLEAGGLLPNQTIVCTMYAASNQCLLDNSNTVVFDGSSPKIHLTIPSTLGKSAYIECFLPSRNGWIGNITWNYWEVS